MSYGIVFINLAFLFYTVGVWSERIHGRLKSFHLVLFWLGIVCDTLGTLAMEELARVRMYKVPEGVLYYWQLPSNFHGLTGIMALTLMLLHAVGGSIILFKKEENWIKRFHRFSVVVWLIWLLPFLSGVIFHLM